MDENTNLTSPLPLGDLVDLVNQKTLLKLHKKIISEFEWTPNRKIRIVYTNGTAENFGSYYDCFETLNSKYHLQLQPYFSSVTAFKPLSEENDEIDVTKRSNAQIAKIIDALKKDLDDIERSKRTVHRNVAELKQTISYMSKEIATSNPYDLNNAIANLFKQAYAHDKDMSFYYRTIKKEIDDLKEVM